MVRAFAVQTQIQPADLFLHRAAELIRAGKLVAFPTETVYGLGADAGSESAVRSIYHVKGRPANNPLIVHVADVAAAQAYTSSFPRSASALAETFWPGPLTMVLPRNDRISPAVSAEKSTLAIRCPAHPVALALLRESGRPIAAPSANRSGRTSPTTAQHVFDDLQGLVELILDGGACSVGLESTVVDLTADVPMILRPGAITPDMMARCLAAAGLPDEVEMLSGNSGNAAGDDLKSPGLLESHYAPRTPALRFYASDTRSLHSYIHQHSGKRLGMLCMEHFTPPPGIAEEVRLPADDQACGQVLYQALRDLDHRRCDVLLVQYPEDAKGLWPAIADRLRRATKEMPI
jgi:L-threonylcarbamoyladenylate synthase